MRPTSLGQRRYILIDRDTGKCCSTYLGGPNNGLPCIYEFHDLAQAKRVFADMGVEVQEREVVA